MRVTALVAACAVLAAPPSTWAATVYTVSAQRLEAELTAITADGKLLLVQGGKKSTLPLDRVYRVRLRDTAAARSPAAAAEVRTVEGTCLYGTLARSNRAVGVRSRAVGGTVHFAIEQLLGVRFARKAGPQIDAGRFEREIARPDKDSDVLFVSSPKGVIPYNVAVERIAPDKTRFNWNGEDRSVETSQVAAVVLANSRAAERPQASVRLADASVLNGGLVGLQRGRLELELSGVKLKVPLAGVLSMELANPNVVYLSDLRPARVQETPFFNHVWKHRVDRSVWGNPLSLGGRVYDRGIGCHTRTVLTYDIGGEYRKLAAVIGIDDEVPRTGAGPYGSVEFKVEADGKTLRSAVLTGRDKPARLVLDISKVRRLSLIADFGADANVGDHADWADVRLLK